jgi:hypothetical protein
MRRMCGNDAGKRARVLRKENTSSPPDRPHTPHLKQSVGQYPSKHLQPSAIEVVVVLANNVQHLGGGGVRGEGGEREGGGGKGVLVQSCRSCC